MKLGRIIPLTSLAVVIGVVAAATLYSPAPDFPFTEPPPGSPPPVIDLGLGEGTLFGLVVDGDGRPLDGAGVALKDGQRPVYTWTRADGTFELTEVREGPVRILAVALGFQATGFEFESWPQSSEDERLALSLDRPTGAAPELEGLRLADLEGQVGLGTLATEEGLHQLLFTPTGSPSDPGGGFPRRVDVDQEGRFRVPQLSIGEYRVTLLDPQDRGGRGPDLLTAPGEEPLTYTHGDGDGRPPLALASKAGAIQGRVSRAPSAEGSGEQGRAAERSIRGAFVRVERLRDGASALPEGIDPGGRVADGLVDGAHFRAARTDDDGRFRFRGLPPGHYRLSTVAGRAREVTLVEVRPRESLRVELRPR